MIEKTNKDVTLLAGKLSNANFVKNAPEEIVQKDTALLAELRSKIHGYEEGLKRLRS